MKNKSWKDLKFWQKWLIIELILVQIGLFLAAWFDLKTRPAERINGNKDTWRGLLFINGFGPLAYLFKGRKQSHWTEANIPDLSGKTAIVTGANSGIGYETARALAQHGATVIMACRNLEKANTAANKIQALNPSGRVMVMQLDLADLDSVHTFANTFKETYTDLHLLINNAGIMIPPFGLTAQGFESQFGVNHLGHFALTALLIDRLNSTPEARIVTVSSIAHRFGTIDFDDLNWQGKQYEKMQAYGQSKLANLLFTYELQRKLASSNHDTIAVAVHPGYTSTKLQEDTQMMNLLNRMLAQPQPMGALPTLYAATANDIEGGRYYGPSGLGELGGNPDRVQSSSASMNKQDAARLWQLSEQLTNVEFDL